MSYIQLGNKLYKVEKSKKKYKKYDVYILTNKNKLKYLLSYGDNRYQHFYDYLKKWSHLNHNNEERRKNYRRRHSAMSGKNIYNPSKAAFWSYWFLW
jgi:hypothetical protein